MFVVLEMFLVCWLNFDTHKKYFYKVCFGVSVFQSLSFFFLQRYPVG